MSRGSVEVSYTSPDLDRIPDALTEGAVLLMDLRRRGIVHTIGELVRIRRQGGFCGLDVWVFLLLFFSAEIGGGMKSFWEDVARPHAVRLAALAGRRRLPSPAALTRALGAVESDLLRASSSELLAGVAGVDNVLRHPAVQTYDTQGQGWHVYDLDPTVKTLRHRALPVDDDLPEPRRRSTDTGARGHSGRKRGDIQFRRVTVQHAGSGMWTHAHLSPGNGEGMIDFERGADTIVETSKRLGHPLERTLVRMDGEYGHVPWYAACRERGLPFITRLNRAKLYEDPEVLIRLRTATWYAVPDSLSGPRRGAADLGILTVHPGQATRRPDGGRYEPIAVRVVASRFPRTGKANHGRILNGWQVELFAVDVAATAWPAPEAITAYFARNGEENRFAQEDRELGLDRIISYHLPGQELATLVGLALWNLRLARGFDLERPPAACPVQPPRQPRVDERVPQHWPRDPVLCRLLDELDWTAMLAQRPGWRWDAIRGELICEDERRLALTTVRPKEHAPDRTNIILRRPVDGCEDCPPRPRCLRSERPQACKHVEIAIPTPVAEQLRERLSLIRKQPLLRAIQPIRDKPGPRAVLDTLFLPAEARHAFGEVFLGATLRAHVDTPPQRQQQPRLLAVDVADRQRRRKTWAQNVKRNELPHDASVRVEVAGSLPLRTMLGERRRDAGEVACAG
jgi:hypothetical protein